SIARNSRQRSGKIIQFLIFEMDICRRYKSVGPPFLVAPCSWSRFSPHVGFDGGYKRGYRGTKKKVCRHPDPGAWDRSGETWRAGRKEKGGPRNARPARAAYSWLTLEVEPERELHHARRLLARQAAEHAEIVIQD